MKTCRSSSWCLLVLLLAVCTSSAMLTRSNARSGATLGSYKQAWPSLAEAVLWDLLQMANEATAEDEWRSGAEEQAAPLLRSLGGAVGGGLGGGLGGGDVAGLPAPVGPRERKAGCKNFFWKTFTSC